MKKKILIFGSGSIGTHHANAAITLKNDVFITDKNNTQLDNMKKNIYPQRYGKWNNKINCIPYDKVFNLKKNFDLIILGIPPKLHLKLLKKCIKHFKFKKILVEKPLCVYNQNFNFLKKPEICKKIYCGFNHSVSESFQFFLKCLKKINKKDPLNIDLIWKESFNLVLKAHPWILSLKDSYLAKTKNGGGVSHEYSHALHLLILLREALFQNKKIQLKKKVIFKKKKNIFYDQKVKLQNSNKFNNHKIFVDINSINNPPEKKIVVKHKKKIVLSWVRKLDKGFEYVIIQKKSKINKKFKITRRLDFINELQLLLKNKGAKKTKYLNLDYAIKVNSLLRNIFI